MDEFYVPLYLCWLFSLIYARYATRHTRRKGICIWYYIRLHTCSDGIRDNSCSYDISLGDSTGTYQSLDQSHSGYTLYPLYVVQSRMRGMATYVSRCGCRGSSPIADYTVCMEVASYWEIKTYKNTYPITQSSCSSSRVVFFARAISLGCINITSHL